MSARVYETITRHNIGPWRIRLWHASTAIAARGECSLEVVALLAEWSERAMFDPTFTLMPVVMREELADLPGVAAVEITGEDGAGLLAYNDWP